MTTHSYIFHYIVILYATTMTGFSWFYSVVRQMPGYKKGFSSLPIVKEAFRLMWSQYKFLSPRHPFTQRFFSPYMTLVVSGSLLLTLATVLNINTSRHLAKMTEHFQVSTPLLQFIRHCFNFPAGVHFLCRIGLTQAASSCATSAT